MQLAECLLWCSFTSLPKVNCAQPFCGFSSTLFAAEFCGHIMRASPFIGDTSFSLAVSVILTCCSLTPSISFCFSFYRVHLGSAKLALLNNFLALFIAYIIFGALGSRKSFPKYFSSMKNLIPPAGYYLLSYFILHY